MRTTITVQCPKCGATRTQRLSNYNRAKIKGLCLSCHNDCAIKPPIDRELLMAEYHSGISLYRLGIKYYRSAKTIEDYLIRAKANIRHRNLHAKISDSHSKNIAQGAIRRGKISPKPCEICGADNKCDDGRRYVQAHHDDYNFPLKVRWLCCLHHLEWHANHLPIPRAIV